MKRPGNAGWSDRRGRVLQFFESLSRKGRRVTLLQGRNRFGALPRERAARDVVRESDRLDHRQRGRGTFPACSSRIDK